MGGAWIFCCRRFQSTLPVWGATLGTMLAMADTPISIHAPRVGSDIDLIAILKLQYIFQSTLPVWGATRRRGHRPGGAGDFNPRSPCGERRSHGSWAGIMSAFQSTLPVWGATWATRRSTTGRRFQSTLPVWGATVGEFLGRTDGGISIHAPRVGSDYIPELDPRFFYHFNPRSPCGERRAADKLLDCQRAISIHAPRVGSDGEGDDTIIDLGISIHAPRVGSDAQTRSARLYELISIHAPRVGSDAARVTTPSSTWEFQSTLPVWGATAQADGVRLNRRYFNPRSPCGERPPYFLHGTPPDAPISIHAPRVGSDNKVSNLDTKEIISIHAPRVGSDELRRKTNE